MSVKNETAVDAYADMILFRAPGMRMSAVAAYSYLRVRSLPVRSTLRAFQGLY